MLHILPCHYCTYMHDIQDISKKLIHDTYKIYIYE